MKNVSTPVNRSTKISPNVILGLAQYNPSNPQFSHYTQIVWKGTTQVGCGLAPACTGIFGNVSPVILRFLHHIEIMNYRILLYISYVSIILKATSWENSGRLTSISTLALAD